MLTDAQQKWIDHLSEDTKIHIVPFDPTAEEKFQRVKMRILEKLGQDTSVEHHGASALGISGQDEIDMYLPIPEAGFNAFIAPLTTLFGEPKSHYPLERARFVTEEGGKHVDVFLINEEHNGWKSSVKFEKYLRTHPASLEEYRVLKEGGEGLSVREYYRRKIEFINKIVELADTASPEAV